MGRNENGLKPPVLKHSHSSRNITRISYDILRINWKAYTACNFNCRNWRTARGHWQWRTLWKW